MENDFEYFCFHFAHFYPALPCRLRRLTCRRPLRLHPSDPLRFHKQQHDSADECERSDDGRDKMIVGGRNVHPKKINGFSRGRETEARISEHHNSQGNQGGGKDGFCVHIEFII